MVKKIVLGVAAIAVVFAFLSYSKIAPKPENGDVNSNFRPIVVLELFTSQGCSSCPPADRLLEQVKHQFPDEVFALSYHVDYWNYIGWEDPFSNSSFTKKQREYNDKFNYRSNYTPEVVVNGREHFVGSNGQKMNNAIARFGQLAPDNELNIANGRVNGREVSFDFEVQGPLKGAQLRTVLVLDERTTVVKRGENRNRTLTNSNIVVAENYKTVAESKGISQITIPSIVRDQEELYLMVFLENEDADITAAAKFKVSR